MDVLALVRLRFVHFHLDAMRIGPGVLTDASILPVNFDSRLAGLDGEASVDDFRRDDGLRKLADHGELIAEIGIQSLEPRGHADHRCAAAVGDDVTVIDIHHVGRFDEGMIEIFVRRIERMIDLKGAAGLAETASDGNVALEISRVRTTGAGGVNSNATSAGTVLSRAPVCVNAVTADFASPPG